MYTNLALLEISSTYTDIVFYRHQKLSEADKVHYVAKAVKRKVDYENDMKAYKKKKAEGANVGEEEGSEKSLSEVNNDDGNGEEDNVEQELALKV